MTAESTDDQYLTSFVCASLLLATDISDAGVSSGRSKARERSAKMRRVRETKAAAWRELGESEPPSAVRLWELTAAWTTETRRELLVDLAFSDPFAPYALKFERDALLDGLRSIAPALEERPEFVDEIETVRKAATKAHSSSKFKRIGVVGFAAALALGSAGWLAAPAIATALGTSAGLTGAAATAHGLAILGGGSLAAGGSGMAGGMWLVAGTAASAGVVGGSGSALMYQLGASEARSELIKLQVTFRIAVLGTQTDLLKAQQAISALEELESELRGSLEHERLLNDENSDRVKVLAEKLEDLISARAWMTAEADHVA